DGLRHTARALHRALTRTPSYSGIRLLWLYSEDEVAAELRQSAGVLPRLAPDAELRAALQGEGTPAEAPAAADPDPASVASAPAGPLAVPATPAPAVPATPSTTAQAMPTTFPASTDRKSTRLNSSHVKISYAVFCLKKKNTYMLL